MALPLDQVKVIDADTHMTERHDLWTSRAPATLQGPRARTSREVDGAATWVVEGAIVLGRAGAGGVVDKHGNKGRSFEGLYEWEIEQAHAAAYDPVARVRAASTRSAIWAQIIFPGVVGLGGQTLGERREGRRAAQRSASRSSTTRTPRSRRSRATGCCRWRSCPRGTSTRACARCSARRISACAASTSPPTRRISARPTSRAARGIRCGTRAASLELPVHFHIGASLTTMNFFGTYPWDSHDDDTKLAIGGTLLFIGNARVVVNIICSGMLDRFPELKIVSVESGTGWIPFILEALDYEMDENAPRREGRACRCCRRSTSSATSTRRRGSSTRNLASARATRSARTTSCSRPTSRTRRACTPIR